MRAARAGDREAFRSLYESHAPLVHAVLVSSVDAGTAEDLLQDVFLAAWQALDDLRDPARFGAWLATIARNRARRHHARGAPAMSELPDDLADLAGREPRGEDGGEVLAALRTLPEAYRETLALRLIEGWNGPRIAAATGLTPGSVRVNLTRGMKLLREKLCREGKTT